MAPHEPSLQNKDFMELIKWMEGTRQAGRREEMTGQREETTGDSKMMQDSAQLLRVCVKAVDIRAVLHTEPSALMARLSVTLVLVFATAILAPRYG